MSPQKNPCHKSNARRLAILGVALLSASRVALAADIESVLQKLEWPMFGQNWANTASGLTVSLGPNNVDKLKPKWTFTTHGDVSARASVASGGVYFPDWGGYLYRVNSRTGALVWSKNLLADYGLTPSQGATKIVSRTTPAIEGDTIYVGTQATADGAFILAINAKTGALKWKTLVDPHPLAIATSAPVVFNDVVYTGVASLEEGAAANPAYPCCSFRGSAIAINAKNGQVLWKRHMAPQGYTGSSVWGSSVVPDPLRGMVYVTTGNNYKTPDVPEFKSCTNGRSLTDAVVTECISDDDYVDSVVALDMKNGTVRWSHRLWGQDDWNVACLVGFASGQGNCPDPQGPDFDFASGANLFVIKTKQGLRQVLGAGQKSGTYSVLDPASGKLLWATNVAPALRARGARSTLQPAKCCGRCQSRMERWRSDR
jgi:polyvinyl alcohol dehydrogenase (cytochrome)